MTRYKKLRGETSRPSDDIADLEATIDDDGRFLSEIFKGMRKAKIAIELPKFGVDSGFSLNDALCNLGLGEMFQDGIADFSGMTGGKDLYVSQVVHKAMVDVNEEDTEAAAATGMIMKYLGMRRESSRISMRVDRPFLFAIVSQNVPLFMGRVLDL